MRLVRWTRTPVGVRADADRLRRLSRRRARREDAVPADGEPDLHADDAQVHRRSAERPDRRGEIRQARAGEAAVGEITRR